MKTIHRKLKYFYCFSALAIYPSLHAGGQTSSFFDREDVQSIGKTIIDMLIDRIPFLGKAVSEYRLEHKVDRLGQGQRTGLDQLRALAKQAIKTKEKVEEMYYFTQQSIRIADDLRQNLQSGKGQNFLGALVEIWTDISVNPADYIPATPSTKQLKENLEWDLSAESGLVRQYEYFLQGTRAALLAQPGLFDKGPEQFNRAYQEAVRYEQELIKALSAKEQATIILYTAEIEKLQAQIKVLEERQQQEGLTISDRMQIARTIDNKKQIIRELNEKVTEGIKDEMQPTTKQQEALEQQQAANDVKIMEDDHNTERARMHLLLFLSGDGLKFRRLPDEHELVFEATATNPTSIPYKPNQAIEIPLRLTSEEQAALEAEFSLLSATLSDGTDVRGHLTHDPLRLQENIVRYTPQSSGVHDIQFRIGVPYEEEGVQEATCRVEVPAVAWSLQGVVTDTGALTVEIRGVPEEWTTESWRIVGEPQWSAGLEGKIFLSDNSVWEDTPLRRGSNNFLITLTQPTLNAPHLCFTLEGPDKEVKSCRVDLTQLCIGQLKGGMSEEEGKLATRSKDVDAYIKRVDEFFIQDAQGSYRLPPETATDPRANREKEAKLTTLLGEIESYQRAYEKNLQTFEAYLESLDQGQTNTNVHIFRRDHKRLQGAIASLKSAQVQLGCRCTSAHEALFKQLREGEQEETEILLEDPKLDPNAKCRSINNGKETEATLLHAAVKADNELAVRKLLEKGADVNERSTDGAAPLHEAAGEKNQEVVRLLLDAGAEVNNQHGQWATLSRVPDYNHFVSLLDQLQQSNTIENRDGISPLHIAAASGNAEVLTLLLNRGADVNASNVNGTLVFPLHVAAVQGSVEAVNILLDSGAYINARASRWTPLHVAAWMDQVDLVKVLLNRGAEVNPIAMINHCRATPYEMAKTREVRDLLQASGGRGARITDGCVIN